MSLALAFSVSALSAGCLRSGARVPFVNLLIIAGLCSGLALLPSVGWVLATVIMSLLILRTTDADARPDALLMLVGSNVIWLLVRLRIVR